MAIINDEEDPRYAGNMGGGSAYLGGGIGAGSQGSMPAPNTPKNNEAGTGFVNLQKWIDMSSGGAKQAGAIAGQATTLGNQAMTDIGTFTSDADKAITNGTPTFNQDVANSWMTGVGVNQDTLDSINSTGTTQHVTAQTDPNAGTYDYKGPDGYSSISSFGIAQKSAGDTEDWNKKAGTEEGLQTQLKGIFGQGGPGSYTNGENRLDTVFAKSRDGAGILAKSQNDWSGINDYLGQSENAVQGKIVSAKDQATLVGNQWATATKNAQDEANKTNALYDTSAEKARIAIAAEKARKEEEARIAAASAPPVVKPNKIDYSTFKPTLHKPAEIKPVENKQSGRQPNQFENFVLNYLVPQPHLSNPAPSGILPGINRQIAPLQEKVNEKLPKYLRYF